MKQAISISQEFYDQESLLYHHMYAYIWLSQFCKSDNYFPSWRHEIAFLFPLINTNFFDEIYRDSSNKDQLDNNLEFKYSYSYIAQSMAHIRLRIDQVLISSFLH